VIFRTASRAISGVGMSGWPIFRLYTFMPLLFASSAKGASFLIGDSGIIMPFLEMDGILYIIEF
jgi:hypothetical protein